MNNFRLYFGAVIGWELLEYRLAIDIFSHLLGLIHLSRQDAVLENEVSLAAPNFFEIVDGLKVVSPLIV